MIQENDDDDVDENINYEGIYRLFYKTLHCTVYNA